MERLRRQALTGLTVCVALVCGSCRDRTQASSASSGQPPTGVASTALRPAIWTAETAWSLEEDLRLGSVDGDSATAWTRIASLAADSRDFIYVLDAGVGRIQVFDADGSYRRTIGRRGDGPGEFRLPRAVQISQGDSLFVVDQGAVRYSVFGPDGEFVRSYPRWTTGYVSSATGRIQSDGAYVDWDITFPEGRMGPRAAIFPMSIELDSHLETDTFPPIEHEWKMLPKDRMPEVTFSGTVVSAAGSDGTFWFAHSDQYRVYRRTLRGDTTAVLRAAATAATLTDADRDFVRDRFGRRPDLLADYLSVLPDTRPIIFGILPDGDGHVFVFLDAQGPKPRSLIDVYEEGGTYLGRMEAPFSIAPRAVGQPPVGFANDDYLLVVRKDSLDVSYVSRLRVIRPT